MAAAEDTSFKVEKLTADNYHSWKFNMKMLLIGKDLWEIVNGTETLDENANENERARFRKRENQALASVCLAISTSLQIYVRSSTTAKDAWSNLEKHFEQKSLSRKILYRRKLYSAHLEKGRSMIDHINYIKTLSEHLEAVDDPVQEKDLVIILISSLPEEYNYLITALETIGEEKLTWEYVRDRLMHEADKMEKSKHLLGNIDKSDNTNDALFTKKQDKRKAFEKKICHYCKKPGHFARDCYKKKADTKRAQEKYEKPDKGRASGNFASNTAEKDTEPDVALEVNEGSCKDNWLIDSGASQHMTPDKRGLTKFERFSKPVEIKLADNSVLYSYGKGDVYITTYDGDKKVTILLKEVLYVPKIQHKLLSLSSMTEKGAQVEFIGQSCKININDKIYSIGHKHGKLYKLNSIPQNKDCCIGIAKDKPDLLSLWHFRYGHLGYDNILALKGKAMVNGMNIQTTDTVDKKSCEGCALGKQHRQPFPKKSDRKTCKPLELIHTDLCGPMSIPSVGGSRFFVLFIDDYSRYTCVYTIKHKSEVLEKFTEFVEHVENLFGYRVTSLRSDNGTEYSSQAFAEYCKLKGIRRECTIPYTPQQNGVAERANRTIMESARSMLYHSNLPLAFWAEAVSTAVYLKNRSPTSSLKDMTPYECWYNRKPDVSNIRVFGCKTYVHIPDQKRGKLDRKSVPCIFVGYPDNSKGYKLYNPESKQMVRSRDVIFLEDNFNHKLQDNEDKEMKLMANRDLMKPETESVRLDYDNTVANDEQMNNPENSAQEVDHARPQRKRAAPDRLGAITGEWWNLTSSVVDNNEIEPKNINEAFNGNNSKEWKDAMCSEFKSLTKNHTWDLVDMPEDKNIVGCKWVFKVKHDDKGNIARYKARLVAQGYTQREGIDYEEVYAPVVKYNSIRTLLAIANELDLDVHQMDVKCAFLQGELEEEIFMQQPEGFIDKDHPDKVCRLRKSIYGLKQSARCWNFAVNTFLKDTGYVQSNTDSCMYTKSFDKDGKKHLIFIAIYVDDVLLASNDASTLNEEKAKLSKHFEMVDQGEIHFCLGMKIKRNRAKKILSIDQRAYLENVLKRFKMLESKPVSTPMEAGKRYKQLEKDEENVNIKEYQAAIGCLTYASIATRPDLSAAVGELSKFMSNPGKDHWSGIKRIMRYVKGTLNYGLQYESVGNGEINLSGYSDADWGGDLIGRKSTSGYVFKLGSSTVSWRSKRQSVVALSSTEAEYIALSMASQETIWIRHLLESMNFKQKDATTLFEDNQGSIALAKNPKDHSRAKHIDIKYHFVRQAVEEKSIQLVYCPTENMLADILTKGLPKPRFEQLRLFLGVKPV